MLVGFVHREVVLHLAFHSYEYVHAYCDYDGMFSGYKWCNIAVAEMYHFLGIFLKMS